MEKIQAAEWSWEFIFQVRKHKYEKKHINMAERLPCMGSKWGTRNQTLKVILLTNWTRFCAKISSYSALQILIHTINSESHGFFGQFWENRPSVLFWSFSNRPHCVRAILKNFKMNLGLFIPNCPQTHMRLLIQITMLKLKASYTGFFYKKPRKFLIIKLNRDVQILKFQKIYSAKKNKSDESIN